MGLQRSRSLDLHSPVARLELAKVLCRGWIVVIQLVQRRVPRHLFRRLLLQQLRRAVVILQPSGLQLHHMLHVLSKQTQQSRSCDSN